MQESVYIASGGFIHRNEAKKHLKLVIKRIYTILYRDSNRG